MRKEYYFWIKVNTAKSTDEYWKYKNNLLGLPRLIPDQVRCKTCPSFAYRCWEGVQPRTVWVWLHCYSIPPPHPCSIASGRRKGEHALEVASFYSVFFWGEVARTSPADSLLLLLLSILSLPSGRTQLYVANTAEPRGVLNWRWRHLSNCLHDAHMQVQEG